MEMEFENLISSRQGVCVGGIGGGDVTDGTLALQEL